MPAEIPDGAVLVARALLNSSLWTMRLEDCKVAITCICLANWRPRKWWSGAEEIEIQRGQFVASWERLSVACQLSLQRVRTSVGHLEQVGFLTRKGAGRFSIFTLPKYNRYQDLRMYSDAEALEVNTKANIEPTSSQHRGNNKQEGKNGRSTATSTPEGPSGVETVENPLKRRKTPDEPPAFVRFWSAYPACYRKQDRAGALREWLRLAPSDELADVLLEVLKEHARSREWERDDGRFIPKPANWLSARAWEGSAEVFAARTIARQEERRREKEDRAARLAERDRIAKEAAELSANPERWRENQDKLRKAAGKLTGPLRSAVVQAIDRMEPPEKGK